MYKMGDSMVSSYWWQFCYRELGFEFVSFKGEDEMLECLTLCEADLYAKEELKKQ